MSNFFGFRPNAERIPINDINDRLLIAFCFVPGIILICCIVSLDILIYQQAEAASEASSLPFGNSAAVTAGGSGVRIQRKQRWQLVAVL